MAEGALLLRTNDPDEPEVRIDLVAVGAPNTPPVACAGVSEIRHQNGDREVPADPAMPTARPADRVFLTAHPEPTCSADPEGGALEYAWTLVSKPPVSGARLTNAQNGPAPGGAEQPPYFDVDAIGRYEIELVVTDPEGAASMPATLVVDAVPKDDITVELSWRAAADLDLHLLAPGGAPFCDPLDCFWDICLGTSAGVPALDWGPDQNSDGKLDPDTMENTDPILVFDNVGNTILPGTTDVRLENIRVPVAPLGTYRVAVHYFEDKGVATPDFEARVKLVYKGTVLLDETRTFARDEVGVFWTAGQVDIATGQAQPLGTLGTYPAGVNYTGPVPCP